MTTQELRFDMDHVRLLLNGHPATYGLRNRYIKSWGKWLTWCQDRGVKPGEVGRGDVADFMASIPANARDYVQTDVCRIYSLLGAANPARRLRPLSPGGRESHDKRWFSWLSWLCWFRGFCWFCHVIVSNTSNLGKESRRLCHCSDLLLKFKRFPSPLCGVDSRSVLFHLRLITAKVSSFSPTFFAVVSFSYQLLAARTSSRRA